ncbi:regulatory protein RecX [Gryllotalpicola reticulitermitis]|uniref:Regulatory protein RecX n=1 Tax=Gryllotalpicola reticulitermitis TaxID=1184153 RepID=A0ABV8Q694_9MICO
MVVRFFPSDEERKHPRAEAGREPAATGARESGGLAPVTYLPGASPSEQAQAALASVRDLVAAAAEGEGEGGASRRDSKEQPFERAQEKAGKRAANVSLHQLARRGMSRWELEQVLRKRGVDESVAEAELTRLASVGLLDDAALAVSMVYAARARKGQGRQAIERELRRRHIDGDAITEALADFDQDDERERAIEVAMKRVTQLSGLDDQTAERRLYGYLMRRGYSGETVSVAVGDAMRSRR